MSDWAQIEAQSKALPTATAPATPAALFQEPGTRYSNALPYELTVTAAVQQNGAVTLKFQNTGSQGAVFHVYDKKHLDRIPRRYTVEAGKEVSDNYWNPMVSDHGAYDLWVYGPNGFVRTFSGNVAVAVAEVEVSYRAQESMVSVKAHNSSRDAIELTITANFVMTVRGCCACRAASPSSSTGMCRRAATGTTSQDRARSSNGALPAGSKTAVRR